MVLKKSFIKHLNSINTKIKLIVEREHNKILTFPAVVYVKDVMLTRRRQSIDRSVLRKCVTYQSTTHNNAYSLFTYKMLAYRILVNIAFLVILKISLIGK